MKINSDVQINLDMKKLGKNEKSPPKISPNYQKKSNDNSDYFNAHKMFVELNVKY